MTERAERNTRLNGLRILIADDEILIAVDLEATLRAAGAEVVGPCTTLHAAMRAAESEPISAAVLDVRLGRATTQAVASTLADRGIPFMFYCGQDPPDEIQAHFPNVPALIKPVRREALLQAVARVVGERR